MPLSNAEIDRIRAELWDNTLSVGAEPYIGVHAIFDTVIKPFLREGQDTTSTTSVAANAVGAPVILALDDPTGFATWDEVYVDVDDYQERATVRGLDSGTGISVILKKEHQPPYPVTVDSGIVIVRECLRRIREIKDKASRLYVGGGALKRVDEIEFYAPMGLTAVGSVQEFLKMWREELALALGLKSILDRKRSHGTSVAMW